MHVEVGVCVLLSRGCNYFIENKTFKVDNIWRLVVSTKEDVKAGELLKFFVEQAVDSWLVLSFVSPKKFGSIFLGNMGNFFLIPGS